MSMNDLYLFIRSKYIFLYPVIQWIQKMGTIAVVFIDSIVRNRQSLTRTVSVWGHAFCCIWYANQKPCFDSEKIFILKMPMRFSPFGR